MSNARTAQAKQRRRPIDPTAGLPPLNRNAAGIDVGSAEHSVAVPADRSPEPVRRFASCTAEPARLGRLAARLPHRDGRDGKHRGVLDPPVPNPGSAGL